MATSFVILYLISFKENYIVHAHRGCENIVDTHLNTFFLNGVRIDVCSVLTVNDCLKANSNNQYWLDILILCGSAEPCKACFCRNKRKLSLFSSWKAVKCTCTKHKLKKMTSGRKVMYRVGQPPGGRTWSHRYTPTSRNTPRCRACSKLERSEWNSTKRLPGNSISFNLKISWK